MRRIGWLALVPCLLFAPAAEAALPKRNCASRAEGPRPIARLAGPDDVQLGPVAFAGLHRLAPEGSLDAYRDERTGGYLVKAPLFVRAGRVVNVKVTGGAGLTFAPRGPRRGVPRVRFVACDRDQPAFSYDGKVGAVTAFAGGFWLSQPTCVTIRVAERGGRAYTTRVPIGIGVCGRI